MIIAGLSGGKHLVDSLVTKLRAERVDVISRFFPDGEIYVKFEKEDLKDDLILLQSMYDNPNSKLIEYFLAAKTAKELGAKRIIGVIPYMAYARQDRRFKPGEAISIKIIADLIKKVGTDYIVTIDMHLHRLRGSELHDIFGVPVENLTAMPLLARALGDKIKECIVVGPDDEALEFAKAAASEFNLPYTNLSKKRISDREVEIVLSDKSIDVKDKDVLIVDDIVSTGGTIVKAVEILRSLGVKDIYVGISHALLAPGALDRINRARINDFYATNTVKNPLARVDVSELLYNAIRRLI